MSKEIEQSTKRILTPKEIYQHAIKVRDQQEEEWIKFREEKARRYGPFE